MSVTQAQAAEFLERISSARSVIIGSHLNPDGDALGSSLAIHHFLNDRGIPNEVVNHHVAPRNLEFLPGIKHVQQTPSRQEHDLAIALDLDALERLGKCEPYLAAVPNLIVIDHHVPIAAPGDLRIVETSASATCQIIGELFLEIGATITPEIATCLLAGIVTDTGSFRFRNTSAKSMSIAAKLLECGGNLSQIAEEVYGRVPLEAALLRAKVMSHMKLESNNRIAFATVSYKEFEDTNTTEEDTEGFVNDLLSISTVEIAALLREAKPGKTRVSIRSRPQYDVAEVARIFGGGGHKNAAGCSFDETVDGAAEKLVVELKRCLG